MFQRKTHGFLGISERERENDVNRFFRDVGAMPCHLNESLMSCFDTTHVLVINRNRWDWTTNWKVLLVSKHEAKKTNLVWSCRSYLKDVMVVHGCV